MLGTLHIVDVQVCSVHMCTFVCVCVRMYVRVCMCAHVRACVCVYTCLFMCVYVRVLEAAKEPSAWVQTLVAISNLLQRTMVNALKGSKVTPARHVH